jgi:hypothetical protein
MMVNCCLLYLVEIVVRHTETSYVLYGEPATLEHTAQLQVRLGASYGVNDPLYLVKTTPNGILDYEHPERVQNAFSTTFYLRQFNNQPVCI